MARASEPPTLPEILYEDLCFDAQQAAEKALKGVLVARAVHVPKTHDIAVLLDLAQKAGVAVPGEVREARRLVPYAVSARYPSMTEDVGRDEWMEALALAQRVVGWAAAVIEGGGRPAS